MDKIAQIGDEISIKVKVTEVKEGYYSAVVNDTYLQVSQSQIIKVFPPIFTDYESLVAGDVLYDNRGSAYAFVGKSPYTGKCVFAGPNGYTDDEWETNTLFKDKR